MMSDHDPEWLRTEQELESAGNVQPATLNSPPQSVAEPKYKSVARIILSIMNIGATLFLAATGVLGIMNGIDTPGVVRIVFLGAYLILFAALVFAYEVVQLAAVEVLDNYMKRNLGFLYGIIGKSFFLLFAGVLAFGLTAPRTITMSCGITVCAWAGLQVMLYLKWPQYFDVKEKYIP